MWNRRACTDVVLVWCPATLHAEPNPGGRLSHTAAVLLVSACAAYVGMGLLFGVAFVRRWATRLDPAASAGTTGFRLLILPGSVLLWPWLAWRLWIR